MEVARKRLTAIFLSINDADHDHFLFKSVTNNGFCDKILKKYIHDHL